MPYYRWKGIDLTGTTQKGMLRSPSIAELEKTLFENDVALLWFEQKKTASFFNPVRTVSKVDFFRQLAALLNAGVYVDQALAILYEQSSHKDFKKVLEDINRDVTHGFTLASALQKYPDLFDGITIQLVQAGEHGGKLSRALGLLADYQEGLAEFRKQLRTAALLPSITLFFFIVVCLLIFVAIVPMFSAMFSSLGKALPASTVRLECISRWLRGPQCIAVSLGMVFGLPLLKKILKLPRLKTMTDKLILALPFVGSIILESKITYFLQSTALLLQGKIPIVNALTGSIETIENSYIRAKLSMLKERVNKGDSLSIAMRDEPKFFRPEIIALVRVGEESGTLDALIGKAAEACRLRVKRALHYCATVFQPILMIFLGLLIMALIVSVYVPIFDLSYAIH